MPDEPIIDLQSDHYFMGEALRQARRAFESEEVPVGAVIVRQGRIIARAFNQVELLKDATAHAEMLALTQAEEVIGDWRLSECTIYVTVRDVRRRDYSRPPGAGRIWSNRPQRGRGGRRIESPATPFSQSSLRNYGRRARSRMPVVTAEFFCAKTRAGKAGGWSWKSWICGVERLFHTGFGLPLAPWL